MKNKNPIFMTTMKKLSLLFPDELVIWLKYKVVNGHFPNLRNPKTFNEKLLWLNLHNHDPRLTKLVDKYEVREFVRERIGEKYLVPLIGIWNNVDDIDFSELPDEFVLKGTHDSGSVVVCKDKQDFDIESAKKKLKKSIATNYYYHSREWAYKNVPARIIGEALIPTKDGKVPKDYKIFCFNGEPKMFFVASDRGGTLSLISTT